MKILVIDDHPLIQEALRHVLAALDPSRCEGERQLEIGEREGLEAVCADLVERTLG